MVPHSKDRVKDAPRVAPDGLLEPEEEERLHTYYGLCQGTAFAGTAETTNQHGTVGRDTSGPTTDDAMTARSNSSMWGPAMKKRAGRGCASSW